MLPDSVVAPAAPPLRSAVLPCQTDRYLPPDMDRQKALVSRCGELLHIRYRLLRQALAECLGTLILVVSGGDPEKPLCLRPPQSPILLFTGGLLLFKTALPLSQL